MQRRKKERRKKLMKDKAKYFKPSSSCRILSEGHTTEYTSLQASG